MREYTVKFTQAEMQDLAGLIDAGVRAVGLKGAKVAALLADKLQAALDAPIEEKIDDFPLVKYVKPSAD